MPRRHLGLALIGAWITIFSLTAVAASGLTIVQVTPNSQATVFADLASMPNGVCPGGIGLTTALGLLPHGDVIVGSLPDQSGKPQDAKAGCLLVLDSNGHLLRAIKGEPINGPWDLTTVSADNQATVFVTNVLTGRLKAA